MPRARASEGITIGFLGTGETEVNPATDLIEEFINESIKGDESVRFVFPVTQAEFSDTLGSLAEMALKSKITYEVITNPDDKKKRAFTEIINGAARTYMVTDVWTQLETILVDASKAALMVLWDDKRDAELQDICFKFVDADVNVLDLTNGLARLGREEGEEGEAPEITGMAEGEYEEEDEGTDEVAEVAALEDEAITLYTRPQLEKMSHSDVKDIAVSRNLPPRKARENMIQAILEQQGGPQEAVEVSVEPQVAVYAPTGQQPAQVNLEGLEKVLDAFGQRFMTGLDEFSNDFFNRLEGTQFNLTPEKPMDVEPDDEPASRRRLIRR